MTLAIFDLDNTLIGGDSDHLWSQFVCEQGLVDSDDFAQRSEQFYADYQAGVLDIDAYLRLTLGTLKGHPLDQLHAWHRAFMDSKIKPILLPKAAALIADHRQRGHELLIITATNRFITAPIAAALGVENLIACEAEIIDGIYTGLAQRHPVLPGGQGHPPASLAGGSRDRSRRLLVLQRLAQRPAATGAGGPSGGC